jgi:uncharacterized protein
VIVPDVNLLLYAHIAGFPQHHAARTWWLGALDGDVPVGLAAPAIFGFLRIGTNPKIFDVPLSVGSASAVIHSWLRFPNVTWLTAGPEHLATALRLLQEAGTGGNLTTDAQLAAYAMEYQATLYSNDTDFGRFEGLRWVNPLKPPRAKRTR